jgi:sulfatase modifying factor 1
MQTSLPENAICRFAVNAFALSLIYLALPHVHAAPISIDWVTVGDPANANDTTGYGAVNYEYRIGKYEVTIGQYVAFLNAVAKTDTHGVFKAAMSSDLNMAGISRSGTSGAYVYTPIGPSGTTPAGASSLDQRPISYVSWFDAARFANWISNGQPSGVQGSATTENGAYTISGTTTAPARNSINPNTGASPLYFIPTESEWYKAAYYKGGGTNAGYWAYATQSNVAPGNIIGSGSNRGNILTGGIITGTFSVTQSASFLPVTTQNYLTDVGAFTSSPSAYGTFDQTGNVAEWNDLTATSGTERGVLGGTWRQSSSYASATGRMTLGPSVIISGTFPTGFRLVAVPEPAACIMALAGLACGGYSMWRRRNRA